MEHIQLALSVLRNEIFNLKKLLDNGYLLPQQEEEIMLDIQRLNRAIMEIQKKFDI